MARAHTPTGRKPKPRQSKTTPVTPKVDRAKAQARTTARKTKARPRPKKAKARPTEPRLTVTVFPEQVAQKRFIEPVLGLRVFPRGTRYEFDSARVEDHPKQWMVLGAADYCDLVVDHDSVSARHCLILRRNGRVTIYDAGSKNGCMLNGRQSDEIELHCGALLTLGEVTLLAYGKRGSDKQGVWVGASSLLEYFENIIELVGSERQAAMRLGVGRSSLRYWLEQARAAEEKKQP